MSIEKGPSGPEKTPEELISEFKSDFEKWMVENPDIAEEMKRGILSMAGVEENELIDEEMNWDFGLAKIPLDELSAFGTSCGDVPNRPFSPEVIDFLRSKKVKFVLGLSENKELKIQSAAIEIGEDDGSKLDEMVSDNGGSLRCEASRVEGWSVFESE